MLETIVLGLLCGEPLTGYELKKRIENGPGVFVKVSFGGLYPLLARLCEKGEAAVATTTEGGRVKKTYAPTEQGRKRFDAWLRQPVDVREADNQRLAKIYFFDSLPPAERGPRLAEYRQGTEAYLAELDARRAKLLALPDPQAHYFKLSTLYYGIRVLQDTLLWCELLARGGPLEGFIHEETEA